MRYLVDGFLLTTLDIMAIFIIHLPHLHCAYKDSSRDTSAAEAHDMYDLAHVFDLNL